MNSLRKINAMLPVLMLFTFFLSGCAALIYQLVWQRYLYIGIGVDIDSVTLIVSSFMLGIGVGGALGGWIADRWRSSRLWFYGAAELTLAIFGVCSPWIFHSIQNMGGNGYSYATVCVVAIFVILLPTISMGTTLPLLTMYFDERLKNIGMSVGMLYFFNTLGAAFGAWLSAWVIFGEFGLSASARIAAVINFICFMCVFIAATIDSYISVSTEVNE